jgi:N-acetylglutamate synthase-like GNAT family acetyltransferase
MVTERPRVDNRRVQITVRRAREEDQPVITAMVRGARLNPSGLDWRRFVVAELDGQTVGVAQLRRYSDGATELASLVVDPDKRGHGIATHMIDALLTGEQEPVYTLIDRRFVEHFTRWGFAPVEPSQLPRSVSRGYRIGRVVTAVGSLLRRQRIRIVPLLRPVR